MFTFCDNFILRIMMSLNYLIFVKELKIMNIFSNFGILLLFFVYIRKMKIISILVIRSLGNIILNIKL